MVSTRKMSRNNSVGSSESNSKFRKPIAGPPSILNVFAMILLHLCKKILFFDTHYRIMTYFLLLFASGIFDVVPAPKMMFPIVNNFLNTYFVKLGWFWTLFICTPFVFMTSYTYCCGQKKLVYKHLIRLLIATALWYFWVNFFVYMESLYGICLGERDMNSKSKCVGYGKVWKGLDLSGHTFILIYSNLLLIEEARPIAKWEFISDYLRDENHARDNELKNFGPLRNLNSNDLSIVQHFYERTLPYIRLNFIVITVISIIWDAMLLSTIIYFHTMVEKFISGCIAISIWCITYKWCYITPSMSFSSPGDGSFQWSK